VTTGTKVFRCSQLHGWLHMAPTQVHILAFVTKEACRMFGYWVAWLSHSLLLPESGDTRTGSFRYKLNVLTYNPPQNCSQRERWRHVLNERMSVVLNALNRMPERAILLFSDVDVVFFHPLASLLPWTAHHELTFMREPLGHGGATGRHVVNGGLFAARPTRRVKRFFGHARWLANQRPKLMDQDIYNWLLLAPPSSRMHHRNLSWATWPHKLVTGTPSQVTARTVAFHAIFARTHNEKCTRVRAAFQQRGTVIGEQGHDRGGSMRGVASLTPCEPRDDEEHGASDSGSQGDLSTACLVQEMANARAFSSALNSRDNHS
jgi:hypothetical protein